MKVVVTVTAVYELPDDIEVDGYDDGAEELGLHIVAKGRKFYPVIDFIEPESDDGDVGDDDELDEIYDNLEDSLVSEDYTIIEIDEFGEDAD